MLARSKGLSDLQSDIDSPEADEVKKLLSTLAPEQYKKTIGHRQAYTQVKVGDIQA